ncbi:MAG: flavin reductase family protein [gamma proteobacterium symbiont of Bathyaustriella thionipta]|nr:flavin reductase family protein [gamma proteobacterium symbiont of Bathyaustriella thionipta]MCU7949744.1 flavin reductase family protein [gamma proteobacterium symbiont of Bathyaustriella thionipta]MCU7952487.1 flavin reductase family protein [gamma proteobacterium symbiont of Bathyaustriella thionipta]MCU7956338.1 flavin reductase family protein [gamma proteobacterium symbiont of Bathyaustriella thionipta]MCU7965819.1 flavin reductase family protein [gamma proteobacterium symbiont of Bathy
MSNETEQQSNLVQNPGLVQDYRNTIGLFATGVTVLIIEHEGDVRCMTANAVSSLSLDPVQLLVCPSKKAAFSELVKEDANFSVNILGIHQEDVSNHFAGAKTDIDENQIHYEKLFTDQSSAPRLKDCLASFSCKINKQYDGGDHWIVVGEVTEIYKNDADIEPLLFFGGKYHYPAKVEGEHIQPAGDPYQ